MISQTEPTGGLSPEAPQISYREFSALHASKTNPRTRFEPGPLQDLSLNIEEHGVRMPLLARISKEDPEKLEIVAGERRFRATGLALERLAAAEDQAGYERLFRLPVIVQDLDDSTVLELQLIENLQRQDLTPLEEAQGYQRLLDLEGGDYSPHKISQKIGKSVDTVLHKLRMLQAPKKLQEALEKGVVSERHLVMVASVPGTKAREECAAKVIKGEWNWQVDVSEPLSVRATIDLINREYRASLKKVPWDLDDRELMADAGACSSCPHFAKHAAELDSALAAELGNGRGQTDPMTCMNPACWRGKQDAYVKAMKPAAKEGKVTLLKPADQDKYVDDYGNIKGGSTVVKLDDKLPYEITGHYDEKKAPTWREVLDGVLPDGVKLVANTAKAGVVELVPRKDAIEAAKTHPKHKKLFEKVTAGGKKVQTESQKKEREAELLKNKIDQRMRPVLLTFLSDKALEKGMDAEAALVVLEVVMIEAGMDGCKLLADWLKLEVKAAKKGEHLGQGHYRSAVLEHVKERGSSKAEIDVMIMLASISKWLKVYGPRTSMMEPLQKFFGWDEKTIKALAKSEVEGEMAAKEAKKKPALKSKGRDLDPSAATEKANAAVAVAGIIKQGDKERKLKPSRKPGVGMFARGPEQVSVRGLEEPKHLEVVRQWKMVHPDRGGAAAADELGITLDEALACLDYLIDETYHQKQKEDPKEWPLVQKIQAYKAGTHELKVLIGQKPNRSDKEGLRAWDRARKAVLNGAAERPAA